MHIIYETKENSSQEETDLLCNGLKSNQEEKTTGLDPITRFAILARNQEGKILGGIKGVTYYGCLYVDILWVNKEYRNQRVGTNLINKAEQMGRERGCTFSTLLTMSFEAPDFYKKMGYSVEYVREGYQQGHKAFFFRKAL